jgi:hypothetical protein
MRPVAIAPTNAQPVSRSCEAAPGLAANAALAAWGLGRRLFHFCRPWKGCHLSKALGDHYFSVRVGTTSR